jgi:hypothetical protein
MYTHTHTYTHMYILMWEEEGGERERVDGNTLGV